MMGLSTIRAIQDESRKRAKRNKTEPYEVWPGDKENWPPFPFPSIGNYNHPRWELVKTYFVDSSGFGEDDDGAMSTRQIIAAIKVGYAYAIVEQGQFQLVLGEYQLKKKKVRKIKAKPDRKAMSLLPLSTLDPKGSIWRNWHNPECPGCVNCGRGQSDR